MDTLTSEKPAEAITFIIKVKYTFLNPGWIIAESCGASDRCSWYCTNLPGNKTILTEASITQEKRISVSGKLRPEKDTHEKKIRSISQIWVRVQKQIKLHTIWLELLLILTFHLSIFISASISMSVRKPSENGRLCSGYIPPWDILPAACWEWAKLNSWALLSGLPAQVCSFPRGNITELTLSFSRALHNKQSFSRVEWG